MSKIHIVDKLNFSSGKWDDETDGPVQFPFILIQIWSRWKCEKNCEDGTIHNLDFDILMPYLQYEPPFVDPDILFGPCSEKDCTDEGSWHRNVWYILHTDTRGQVSLSLPHLIYLIIRVKPIILTKATYLLIASCNVTFFSLFTKLTKDRFLISKLHQKSTQVRIKSDHTNTFCNSPPTEPKIVASTGKSFLLLLIQYSVLRYVDMLPLFKREASFKTKAVVRHTILLHTIATIP